jgi:tetratricopeptide (TPR) repeat protein
MKRLSPIVACSLLCSFASLARAQTASERAAARAAANSGRAAFDQGNFAQAVDYFTRAESLLHAPTHLLFLARAQTKLGHLVDANENYSRILHEDVAANAPEAFKRAHADAEKEAAALEPRLASITINVRGASSSGLHVQMDDKELPAAMVGIAIPADAGPHSFKASTDNADSQPVSISAKEGEQQTVTLTLSARAPSEATPHALQASAPTQPAAPPADSTQPSSGKRIAGYVALGVAAVGVGVGSVFALKSASSRKDANNAYASCQSALMSTSCSSATAPDSAANVQQLDSTANSQRNLALAGFITGGVAVAAGVTLLVLDKHPSTKTETGAHVTPVVGLGSLGLIGSF